MPNMRVTRRAAQAIVLPVAGITQLRLELGWFGTAASEVLVWMLAP